MASQLGSYLEKVAASSWDPGAVDCMMFPADWLLLLTGQDPAAEWRGLYQDEDGAARIAARAGGLQALMAAGASRVGAGAITPKDAPPGAVGIVLAPVGATLAQTGAIRTSTGWAVISDAGLSVAAFLALSAWMVQPCPKP